MQERREGIRDQISNISRRDLLKGAGLVAAGGVAGALVGVCRRRKPEERAETPPDKIETSTPTPEPTMTPTVSPTSTPEVLKACEVESIILHPSVERTGEGTLRLSERLEAPKGFNAIIFDGTLNGSDQVYLLFGPQNPGKPVFIEKLEYDQGTFYAICSKDPLAVANRIASARRTDNPNIKIQVWDMRGAEPELKLQYTPKK